MIFEKKKFWKEKQRLCPQNIYKKRISGNEFIAGYLKQVMQPGEQLPIYNFDDFQSMQIKVFEVGYSSSLLVIRKLTSKDYYQQLARYAPIAPRSTYLKQ